jgi:deoxyribonuclease-4
MCSLKIGCHVSIAGGIEKSVIRAKKLGINTMQIFSKNSLTWKGRTYTTAEINHFQKNLMQANIHPVFVHASYLINLASPNETVYRKSIDAFFEEMKRTELLLADWYQPYLIVHPGSHRGSGEKVGLNRIIKALNDILEKSNALKFRTIILLENTSGAGSSLGHTFLQLRNIMRGINSKQNMGICLDTCHAFAAGYNLANKEGIKRMEEDLEKFIGWEKLKVIHLNDSRYPLGSRKDRHMHIGEGYIGKSGFRTIINHPSWKNIPFILETPKKKEEDDRRNISLVKKMRNPEN